MSLIKKQALFVSSQLDSVKTVCFHNAAVNCVNLADGRGSALLSWFSVCPVLSFQPPSVIY